MGASFLLCEEYMDVENFNQNWIVAGASSIGRGHIKENKPIEDSYYCEPWGNGWGIAVVSDGAGSREKSATGSKLVSQTYAPQIFKRHLNKFFDTHELPSLEQWQKISLRSLYECAYSLSEYTLAQDDDFALYACTIIVVIYTPYGILCTHIGDGRACYRDTSGVWLSCMKPYNPDPEEPSATVFITSPIWEDLKTAQEYIGYRVLEGATAFALLSDGVESYCFTCTPRDPVTGDDPNTPLQGFFEGINQAFHGVKADESKIEQEIGDYLIKNPRLANEIDDKTLVFGYFSQEQITHDPSPNVEQ